LNNKISNLKDKIKEKEKKGNVSANRTMLSVTKPIYISNPSKKSSKPMADEGWTLIDGKRNTRKPALEEI
jgi:hypothetical protein